MRLNVQLLKDDLSAIPILATWFEKEWGHLDPDNTFEGYSERLPERAQTDKPPICLVGYLDGVPVATATVKFREIDYAPSADFWVGSVFVREDMRKNQFGTQIVIAAENLAKSRGYDPLYLYTVNKEAFYRRLGWETVGEKLINDRTVKVMSKFFVAKASEHYH